MADASLSTTTWTSTITSVYLPSVTPVTFTLEDGEEATIEAWFTDPTTTTYEETYTSIVTPAQDEDEAIPSSSIAVSIGSILDSATATTDVQGSSQMDTSDTSVHSTTVSTVYDFDSTTTLTATPTPSEAEDAAPDDDEAAAPLSTSVDNSDSVKLNTTGKIGVIASMSVLFLFCLAGVAFWFWRRRRRLPRSPPSFYSGSFKQRTLRRRSRHVSHTSASVGPRRDALRGEGGGARRDALGESHDDVEDPVATQNGEDKFGLEPEDEISRLRWEQRRQQLSMPGGWNFDDDRSGRDEHSGTVCDGVGEAFEMTGSTLAGMAGQAPVPVLKDAEVEFKRRSCIVSTGIVP